MSLKLGVVPYLNVAPLIHGLEGDARFRLAAAVPSQLPDMLRRGDVDLATIPAIEYRDEWAIVPGLGIVSHGAVRSVCLFHRKPVEDVRRVALDTSSRTSVALLKILLAQRGLDPVFATHAPGPEMLDHADAALIIGDPCLAWEDDTPSLDLGAEWTRLTGLPFVWALWAGPLGPVTPQLVAALQQSLADGREAIPTIAARYNVPRPASLAARDGGVAVLTDQAARNEAYLRFNIQHAMGEDEIAGLREFHRRAAALGLIAHAPELRFHATA